MRENKHLKKLHDLDNIGSVGEEAEDFQPTVRYLYENFLTKKNMSKMDPARESADITGKYLLTSEKSVTHSSPQLLPVLVPWWPRTGRCKISHKSTG